jgi:hypothetical protein
MPLNDGAPWMQAAIGLLDVRRRDRLLACGVDVAHARALATLVGKEGELVVVAGGESAAQQLAALELPQVRVLAHRLDGAERFGTFDAMLLAPPFGPLLPLGAWADLARANLRPGGRLVVDVPGPTMVPDVVAAWRELELPVRCAAAACATCTRCSARTCCTRRHRRTWSSRSPRRSVSTSASSSS